jgi:signal transduction histidine kinase
VRRLDVVLTIALAAFVCQEIATSDVDDPKWHVVPVALAATLPFAVRRAAPWAPMAGVVLALVTLAAMDLEQEPQTILLAMLLAFYNAGAHAPLREARVAGATGLAAVFAHEPGDFVVMGPVMAGAWTLGMAVRRQREQAEHMAELTAELERERADHTRLAIAEERARIARELHDVVAHSVSVMTVQAGAERMAIGDERPQTTEALSLIETTGRQALTEMRRLVGLMRRRDEDPELAPTPTLAHLDALAEHLRRSGLDVDVCVEGSRVQLPPGLDVTAYRIVQEALTNSLKHAGRTQAEVRVVYGERDLELYVIDHGGVPDEEPVGGGFGLAGMRERVALFGGELDASRLNGGFRVRARLPL